MAWTRWTGVAAIVVLWSTQAALVVAGDFDLLAERPLSDLALRPGTGFVFGAGLVVAAILFVVFLTWLRRTYPVGLACSTAMVVAMTGQLVAGVVPIGGVGPSNRVHVTAALILGASIPVVMWRFAADQPRGAFRRRAYRLFWLEAAACVVGVTLSQNQVAPLAEILPALAFHAWVGVLTLARAEDG